MKGLLGILMFLAATVATAAPVQFTIINRTLSTVTYNGQAILPLGSFTVGVSQIAGFANDPHLRSDLTAEAGVVLSDGVGEYAGVSALNYLRYEQNRQVSLNDGDGVGVTVGQKSAADSLPVTIAADQPGMAYAFSAQNDYTATAVDTTLWVQVIASTSGAARWLSIFDSCGKTLELGAGGVGLESRILLIPPGGIEANLAVPSGTRLSLRVVTTGATCSTGEFDVNGLY